MLHKVTTYTSNNIFLDGCTNCTAWNETRLQMDPGPVEYMGQVSYFGEETSLWFCRKCNTFYRGELEVLQQLRSQDIVQKPEKPLSVAGHDFYNRVTSELSCGYGDNMVREIGNRLLNYGNSVSMKIQEMDSDLRAVRGQQDKLFSDFTRAKDDMLSALRSKVLSFSLT